MYDFYTELNLFWENYGRESDSLDWIGELQKNLQQFIFLSIFLLFGNWEFLLEERILSNSYSHVFNI